MPATPWPRRPIVGPKQSQAERAQKGDAQPRALGSGGGVGIALVPAKGERNHGNGQSGKESLNLLRHGQRHEERGQTEVGKPQIAGPLARLAMSVKSSARKTSAEVEQFGTQHAIGQGDAVGESEGNPGKRGDLPVADQPTDEHRGEGYVDAAEGEGAWTPSTDHEVLPSGVEQGRRSDIRHVGEFVMGKRSPAKRRAPVPEAEQLGA